VQDEGLLGAQEEGDEQRVVVEGATECAGCGEQREALLRDRRLHRRGTICADVVAEAAEPNRTLGHGEIARSTIPTAGKGVEDAIT